MVSQYFEAFGKGDIPGARRVLWDHLSFKGPIDTFNNADDFVKAIGNLAQIVKGIQPRKTLVDGDDVATFYDMLTPMGTRRVAPRAGGQDRHDPGLHRPAALRASVSWRHAGAAPFAGAAPR